MSDNWIHTLDFCASQGVLDFDAPAFILDKPQRYVGKPQTNPMNLPTLLPVVPNLKSPPEFDGFESQTKKPSLAKKIALGVTCLAALGGLISLGAMFKSGKMTMSSVKNFFRNIKLPKKISLPSMKGIKKAFGKIKFPKKVSIPSMKGVKNFGNTILTYLKKPFTYAKKLFK